MNQIFYLVFLLTCTCCPDMKQQSVEKSISSELSDQMRFDLIYSEWFMCQTSALNWLAPEKYNFSKFDINPNDIIKLQKLELNNNYRNHNDPERRKQIEGWIEKQRDAITALKMENHIKLEKTNIQYLINMLDEQAGYINKLDLQINGNNQASRFIH